MPLRKATVEKLQLCQLCQQKRQKKDRRKVKSRWTDHKFFFIFLVSGQRKRWWWWWWEKARTLNLHAWFCFLLSVFCSCFAFLWIILPTFTIYLPRPITALSLWTFNWHVCNYKLKNVPVCESATQRLFSLLLLFFPLLIIIISIISPVAFWRWRWMKGKKCCSSFAPVSANGCIDQDALCVCVTVM